MNIFLHGESDLLLLLFFEMMVKVINIINIGLQNTTHHHQRCHDHQAKDNSTYPSGGAVTSVQSFFLFLI